MIQNHFTKNNIVSKKIKHKAICLVINPQLKVMARVDRSCFPNLKDYSIIDGTLKNHSLYSGFMKTSDLAWQDCFNRFDADGLIDIPIDGLAIVRVNGKNKTVLF